MSSKERHQAVTDLEGSTTLLQMKDPHPRSQTTNCLHTSVIILALLVGSASLTIAGMLFMEVRELKISMANLNVQILELNKKKSNQDDLGVDGEMQAYYQYDDSDFEVSSGDEIDGIQDDTEEDSEDGAGRHRRAKKTRSGRDKKKSEDALDSYIEGVVDKRIEEQSSLAAIHLAGSVNMGSPEQQTRLHRNESGYLDLPDQHGKMYYQGFMPNNETLAFWKQANWTLSNSKTNATYKFDESAGTIEVQKSGLYFVYAQVNFHETKGQLAYHVKVTPPNNHTLFSCMTGVDHINPLKDIPLRDKAKFKSCYSSGIYRLEKGEKVVVNLGTDMVYIDGDPSTSFMGMLQLSADPRHQL